MAPTLAELYDQTLRTWLLWGAVLAVFAAAVGLWYGLVQADIQVFLAALVIPIEILVGIFLVVTIYYVVYGYLSNKAPPGSAVPRGRRAR